MENAVVTTTVEESAPPKEDKKQTFRILYQNKCTRCAYLFPWQEKVFPCLEDTDCPANRIEVKVGRDPKAVVDRFSKEFALAVYNGDEEQFKEAFRKMFKVNKEGETVVHPQAFEIFSYVTANFNDLVAEEKDAQVASF